MVCGESQKVQYASSSSFCSLAWMIHLHAREGMMCLC